MQLSYSQVGAVIPPHPVAVCMNVFYAPFLFSVLAYHRTGEAVLDFQFKVAYAISFLVLLRPCVRACLATTF